jgi:hypothetical protein
VVVDEAAMVGTNLLVEMFFGVLWYRLLAASGPINRRFADLTDSFLVLAQRAR